MAKNVFNPFDLESSYAGGGSIFNDGKYRCTLSGYTLFDFQQGPKSNTPCLAWSLQPVDDNGKDRGDEVIQYWPVTPMGDPAKTVEMIDPVKGHKGYFNLVVPAEGGEYDKLWGGSTHKTFLDKLQAAWVEGGRDWDQVSGASDFQDIVFDMGKMTVKNTPRDSDKDERDTRSKKPVKETRDIVIVREVMPEEGAKSPAKRKPVEDDEPPAKSSKGGASKGKNAEVGDDIEDIIAAFVSRNLNVKDNYDGISALTVKMAIGQFVSDDLNKGAEMAEKANEYWAEEYQTILKSIGWVAEKVKGKTIYKKSDD